MGLYRAHLNLPGLRFGKTGTFKDDDPIVIARVASGALVRLDGPPVKKAAPPASKDVDGDISFEDDKPDEDVPVDIAPPAAASKPATSTKVAAGAKPAKRKPEETPIERKAPEVSSMNPDLGITFDDEDD